MNQKQAEATYQEALKRHKGGKLPEAERLYRDILRAFPDLDVVRANLSAALVAQNRAEEGLVVAEQAIKINPHNLDAISNKGAALSALGRHAEATEAYQLLCLLDPKAPEPLYNLAQSRFKASDFQAAVAAYRKAIHLNPRFIQAWINLGMAHVNLRSLNAAEDAFNRALQIDPEHPDALSNLGFVLNAKGRVQEALSCFHQALDAEPGHLVALKGRAGLFLAMCDPDAAQQDVDLALDISPDSPDLLVLRGNVCQELEWPAEALDAYQKALKLDPNLPGIADQVARMSASAIPLWHYTMLADTGRNQAYRDAIEKAVKPGMLVLDIGAGTGLLSMMAARAGAEKVIAVELGRTMSEVAQKVIEKNGYQDRVELQRMHSFRLKVGQHLPRKADIIVSEIVDASLLGEGVLPTLRHAWACLAAPDAIMMPMGATVKGILVNLPIKSLSDVEGFDLSDLAVHHYPGGTRNIKAGHDEKYQRLSEPFDVADFDFTKIPDEIPDEHPITWELSATATQDGRANAILIWFVLHLDKEISVSSGPDGTMDHWGLGAYYLPVPQDITQGQPVPVQAARSDKRWWFKL